MHPSSLPELISTHALHEEGDAHGRPGQQLRNISTHALHEEGDSSKSISDFARDIISTHALHEEGDPGYALALPTRTLFLPTPSTRRATRDQKEKFMQLPLISTHALHEEGDIQPGNLCTGHEDFYPRPPRGGRLAPLSDLAGHGNISTHALHEEGDSKCDGKTSILPLTFVH